MGWLIVGVLAAGAALSIWWLLSGEEDRKKRESREESAVRFRSSGNNHDHLKYQHPTQEAAEREIRRMRSVGKDDCETLNAYQNHELGGWYVGNRRW
jgi:hypothetical protein